MKDAVIMFLFGSVPVSTTNTCWKLELFRDVYRYNMVGCERLFILG
jgi:hypothetical protein